jgi:hypothetical protein
MVHEHNQDREHIFEHRNLTYDCGSARSFAQSRFSSSEEVFVRKKLVLAFWHKHVILWLWFSREIAQQSRNSSLYGGSFRRVLVSAAGSSQNAVS